MTAVTISNSGTAWLRDMSAQGKVPTGGWADSPNAAYYASLDANNTPAASTPSTKALPTSLEELIKMQQAAEKDKGAAMNEQVRQQLDKIAADGIPATGNVIDIQA